MDQANMPPKQINPKVMRNRLILKIQNAVKQSNDKENGLEKWSKALTKEKMKLVEQYHVELSTQCMLIECDDDAKINFDDFHQENDEIDDIYVNLKAKMQEHIDVLSISDVSSTKKSETVHVELQTADALANIVNTWGTFNGDYAAWQSFKERFSNAVHDNQKIRTIFKFQYLQAACVGEAKGALGEWELTEQNYALAWNRLMIIYEDDYMQVQAFMRKLHSIPRMVFASSKVIRELLDTVHKCIHGLKRYINTGDKDPFVVFLVIDRMDRDTYRNWEKHRSGAMHRNAAQESDQAQSSNKHIPTWNQLEEFLEREASIHVHDENRSETASNRNRQEKSQPEKSKAERRNTTAMSASASNSGGNKSVPEFLKCKLCEGTANAIHPLFKCKVFLHMKLAERRDVVVNYNICNRCLRPYHGETECDKSKPCKPCPKCSNRQFHNSLLCPTSAAEIQTALLTAAGDKRKKDSNKKEN